MVLPVGGDGTWVEGRGRPALLRPLGVPLHVPMLPPFSLCFTLNQSCHPLLVPDRNKRGGASRPRDWPKIFEIFFVKFSDAKLSNFKHGLVKIRNMIMQVGKKIMQGKI